MIPLRRAVPDLSLKPLAAVVLGAALVAAQAPSAWAENATAGAALQARFGFAIAAQPLPQALSKFSRVTGLSVVYTDEAPYDLQAPAVSGQLSANDALNRLLAGSGYRFRALDGSTLTLERVPTDTLSLTDTTVTGQAASTSYQPAPVASIGRTDTPVLETPQSIVTVPAQALRDQKPRNLDDALGNISGITQANTLGGTQDAVMKRGFGDNRDGSIMRDGLPSVLGRNLTATADHVEVLKGPASLLYGIQDPGGIVNVVSKKPQLQQYNAVTLRGSTYAHGKQGSGAQIDTTGALGESNLAYRLIVDHQDENYWRNFGQQRETLVAPSLAWFGEDTTVNLSYEHREFKTPFDRGTAIDPRTNKPLDIPRTRRLDEPFNITEGRSDLTRLDVEHRIDDAWKAHFAYGWTRETYDDNQARVTKVNSNGTLTRRTDATRGAVSSDSFATAGLNGDLQLGGFRHEVTFGIDSEKRKIYRADLIRDTKNTTFNYLDPVYGQISPATAVSPGDSDQTDKLRSDSLFVQDSWHLDDHWILVAGGRYQMYDQYAGRGRPFKANTDISGQKWVPRAGVIYKINDEMSLYGSYTQSFKPNSTIAPLSTGEVIDSAIQPEEATSWEIGGKLDIPGRVTANLAFFDIRKRNVMVTQLDANGDSRVSTAGKVRSYGAELDVTGQLSEHWNLIGSYAWLDAEVTEDPVLEGNRLQNVAKETASLAAVYDAGSIFGGDNLRLGGGPRYVGKRAGDPANSFELPSYTVTDAFASYDTKLGGHNVGFQFNVKNLFDREYYPSAANNLYVAVGEPRQFEISTTVEF
ncbi:MULTISPECIES: TonB-dependent siderophore receptor [Pseudomonas]|uniref:TonB-dependent siderophore receptor n=1 Tax=Pseudomonas nitroreducens TaxID=46680 RepID=UPI001E3264D0|nr:MULTISPECIES: TonB-dependent receptor [Pseudomonas]MCE4067666.1 TonB-dependent receptor [Pseudomonas nitritireducens]MCE4076855.1 TonB-dependent receptor [Pseudomonas nitroreducens]